MLSSKCECMSDCLHLCVVESKKVAEKEKEKKEMVQLLPLVKPESEDLSVQHEPASNSQERAWLLFFMSCTLVVV